MKRRHLMPFGAELQADGGVRFALWAPAAQRVELCLEQASGEVRLAMAARLDGWFTVTSDRAGPGSRYRYRIDGDLRVPDPASRFQPDDVHGPSEVVDPQRFRWRDADWRGRPWQEAVIYELHVGAFSAEGGFRAVAERVQYLKGLGVTAIELMPVADFPGKRNWGYDGTLPFAPDASYGRPDELKELVQTAHRHQLMVFLDVVYNHFGPEGNYLHAYAPQFFSARHQTPWGAAINFDGAGSETVRRFFIDNALYWLEEYHLDGLRLDAVHAIEDDSSPDVLEQLALAVRRGPGRERHVHLVLENDHNATRYLVREPDRPARYTAQWNDDIHHAAHTLLTGEADGYYADYADRPIWYLGRCLAEGFAYQGEASAYRDGAPRGAPSAGLPPTAFVSFLQNHDQVGNRAFGERLGMLIDEAPLRAAVAVMLLAPAPPLLFMGEEFAAATPFQFFCDFGPELAAEVTAGRRREFASFARFAETAARETIPDPNAPDTYERSRLDWSSTALAEHDDWLRYYRTLLDIRRRAIVPRLSGIRGRCGEFRQLGGSALEVKWHLADGCVLMLLANLGGEPSIVAGGDWPDGEPVFAQPAPPRAATTPRRLAPWSVLWYLRAASR